MAAEFPMVNGKSFDFSSIETSLPLAGILREISEINYSHNVEVGELRANVPWAIATTRGEYKAELSFTISKQGHIWLITKLEELAAGAGYMDYEFPMQVIYSRTGMQTIKDSLFDCRLIGDDSSNSRGTDPTMVACTLFTKAIYPNGVKPFGDMPWAA